MSSDDDAQASPQRPYCQVAGCFEPSSVHVVIEETDVNILAATAENYQIFSDSEDDIDVNTFKLILYLCSRHDFDLKYLLKENELEISRRRHLALKEAS